MIPQDKNFKKDFSAVLLDLDDVLKKHSKVSSVTFALAISTFLTRHLIKTAPNDYSVISILFIECVLEKFWPSFINKKDKYKWIGVHSMSNPNANHKRFTILKNNEPRQSNNNK